jgi:SAM-dependent methyltransferase
MSKSVTPALSDQAYWDARYRRWRWEGSGDGSTGGLIAQKARFIQEQMDRYGLRSVYDYGCGNARVLRALRAERKVGYDFSPAVITLLRQEAASPQTEFTHEAAHAEPEYIAQFDCVTCLEVLFHNHETARKEIIRKIAAARPKLFICCDSQGHWLSRIFLRGPHVAGESNKPMIQRQFSGYEQVARKNFRIVSELYALRRA